jgi:hypothetical protein
MIEWINLGFDFRFNMQLLNRPFTDNVEGKKGDFKKG